MALAAGGHALMRRPWIVVVLILAFVAAVVVALAPRWSGRAAVRAARAEIEAMGIRRADLIAAQPHRAKANASALELERLALAAGIALAPGRNSYDTRKRHAGVRQWHQGQLEQAGEEITAPSDEVIAELDRLASPLGEFARALPNHLDAEWPHSFTLDIDVNLLGHMDTCKLLAAEAMLAHRRGDRQAASEWLEAAWHGSRLLEGRSETISQFIRVAITLQCAVAARKVAGPDDIAARLDPASFRAGLSRAEAHWLHLMLDLAEQDAMSLRRAHDGGLAARFVAPIVRKEIARTALARAPLVALLADPARCGPSTHPAQRAAHGPWAMDLAFESTDAAGEIRRLDALLLHLELTARVLAMKRAREADAAHAWPTSIPGGEASSCPGVRFVLTEPAPGVVRIEAESWEGTWWVGREQRNVLPLAWQSQGADAPE